MKTTHTFLLFYLITFSGFSQNNTAEIKEETKIHVSDRVYKVGYNPKNVKKNDFSAKESQLDNSTENKNFQKKNFWEEWERFAAINKGTVSRILPNVDLTDTYQKEYFAKLEAYYNSLSPRVQNIFTLPEVWYIYSFREDLYRKLKTN